jgi:hypothetical protein
MPKSRPHELAIRSIPGNFAAGTKARVGARRGLQPHALPAPAWLGESEEPMNGDTMEERHLVLWDGD